MNNGAITVLILFQAKSGMEERVRQAMLVLIPPVLAEPNCISVNFHQDSDDPTRFMLYENWADKDYYTGEHMQTPHIRAYLQQTDELLVEPPHIMFYQMLSQNSGTTL